MVFKPDAFENETFELNTALPNMFIFPATSRVAFGNAVLIPTSPFEVIVMNTFLVFEQPKNMLWFEFPVYINRSFDTVGCNTQVLLWASINPPLKDESILLHLKLKKKDNIQKSHNAIHNQTCMI